MPFAQDGYEVFTNLIPDENVRLIKEAAAHANRTVVNTIGISW